ncbi:unnamed protein product, partial [Brassica rapa]
DTRLQICHSLPGGLASATAGGGSYSSFPSVSCEARARKICGVYLESIKRSLWLFPDLVLSFVFLCSVQLVVVFVDRGSLGSLKFDLQC